MSEKVSAPTREEFAQGYGITEDGDLCVVGQDGNALRILGDEFATLAELNRLAAERDEWKRRAEALYGQCTEIAKCPTYYDGCHCTAATVQHNIERADKAEAERDAALSLVRDLMDSHPCDHFDHHGYCQTHGWMQTDPPCPHGRAAKLMKGK